MSKSLSVAVVGAGIVGVSCALWLQKKGVSVTLFDPETPGSGTSSGNACTLADYACLPVNHPNLIRQLPKLIFSTNSPLSINPLYAASHLPWLMRFINHCRADRVHNSAIELAGLLQKTYEGLNPLVELTDSQNLIKQNGCLYLYKTQAEYQQAKADNQRRKALGISFSAIDSDEIRRLEPGVKLSFAKALLFENASQVINPKLLTEKYIHYFLEHGGQHIRQRITNIQAETEFVTVSDKHNNGLTFDRVLVAAGAFSKQIKGAGIDQLPLDTERGYHIQYRGLQTYVNRPVCWQAAGFYATPTDQALRIAGTVEIAGLSTDKNPRNINFLQKKARQMFDLKQPPDENWLGFRPTMPDALPVIGYSPVSNNILLAFGHQHLGLTLAGITGKLISELINDEALSHDLTAFSAERF